MKKKCTKTRFATKEEARRAVSGMATRWAFVYKGIYRCGKCKAYHITSTPRIGGPKRKKW